MKTAFYCKCLKLYALFIINNYYGIDFCSGAMPYKTIFRYIHEVREEHLHIFRLIDKDGNGTISLQELQDGLSHLHMKSRNVNADELFLAIHHETKGEITFDEFESAFGMLNIDDFSAIYTHSHSMFDGGSPGLMADYSSILKQFSFLHSAPRVSGPPGSYDMYLRMLTAGLAGGLAQSAVNPFETVKVRLQNEGAAAVKKYRSFFNGFKVIFTEEGLRGLWKGTFPAICRELIYTSSRMVIIIDISVMHLIY